MNPAEIARKHALVGVATMLLGQVVWSTGALSQHDSTASARNAD